jgi:hypothetical protein
MSEPTGTQRGQFTVKLILAIMLFSACFMAFATAAHLGWLIFAGWVGCFISAWWGGRFQGRVLSVAIAFNLSWPTLTVLYAFAMRVVYLARNSPPTGTQEVMVEDLAALIVIEIAATAFFFWMGIVLGVLTTPQKAQVCDEASVAISPPERPIA